MRRNTTILAGIAATLAAGALWHGPLGAGSRMAARMEARSQQFLSDWDLPEVHARAATGPISRMIILSGPANDFQRAESKSRILTLPGVEAVAFEDEKVRPPLPLVVEAELAALVGFCIGLIIAYLGELRRRSRQWDRF